MTVFAETTIGKQTITIWYDEDTEEPFLQHVEFRREDRHAIDDSYMMEQCKDCEGSGEYDDGADCVPCIGNGEISIARVTVWPVNLWDYGSNGYMARLSDYDPVHNSVTPHPNGALIIDDLSKFLDTYGPQVIVEDLFASFLSEWTKWAGGECYGYTVTTPNVCPTCGHDEPDFVDSCGGFIGLEWIGQHIQDEILTFDINDMKWR